MFARAWKSSIVSFTVGASLAFGWLSFAPSGRSGAWDAEPEGPSAEAKIKAALAKKTDLDCNAMPLWELVERLRERHDIEIQLDSKALADSGLGSDTTITRHIHGITLRSVLWLVLSDLDLTYVLNDEVLLITTRSAATEIRSTRTYRVGDLVEPADDMLVGSEADYEPLIQAITSAVDPESWSDAGGSCRIVALPRAASLLVVQTSWGHAYVEELLDTLRQSVAEYKDAHPEPAAEQSPWRLRVYRLGRLYPGHIVAEPIPLPRRLSLVDKGNENERIVEEAEAALLAGARVPPVAAGGVVGRQGVETADKLADVIPAVIEPTSWELHGGEGVIRAVGGNLIVRQTEPVHREIRRLLKALK